MHMNQVGLQLFVHTLGKASAFLCPTAPLPLKLHFPSQRTGPTCSPAYAAVFQSIMRQALVFHLLPGLQEALPSQQQLKVQ